MEKSERIKRFEKLLAMDPSDSTTYFGLGQAYFNEGFSKEAEQTVKRGLNINSRHTASYFLLSQVLSKLGKKEELLSVLKKGIEVGELEGDRIPTEKMIAKLRRLTKETNG
jgi:tetratricopeptide (TPR) repeat protein